MGNNFNKPILQATDSVAKYEIVFNDRVVLEVLLGVDGYYYMDFDPWFGWGNPYQIKQMAELVIELNRPHGEAVKAYFNKQKFSQEDNLDW